MSKNEFYKHKDYEQTITYNSVQAKLPKLKDVSLPVMPTLLE